MAISITQSEIISQQFPHGWYFENPARSMPRVAS
jgi:hypothetical protein